MGPSGAGAVAVGLWLLVTWRAAESGAESGMEASGRCLLSRYRSLDPRALAGVKALRDRYVSDAGPSRSPGNVGPPARGSLRPGATLPAPSGRALDGSVQNSDHEVFP
ncbi:hypothetical protein MC885_021353 [Smutsia gigantea]|nr:hypothetical protein MC885_021353 [Smutsia gigantea]